MNEDIDHLDFHTPEWHPEELTDLELAHHKFMLVEELHALGGPYTPHQTPEMIELQRRIDVLKEEMIQRWRPTP